MKAVRLGLLLVAFTAVMAASQAQAGTIVSPVLQAAVEGNDSNVFPFGIGTGMSMRYQQVYLFSDFIAGGDTGPNTITAISFRPSATSGGAFSSTLPSVQIDLSTTGKLPNALDATFAKNVGTDDTMVFQGPLTLSSSFVGPRWA